MPQENRDETTARATARTVVRTRIALLCCALAVAASLLGCGNDGGRPKDDGNAASAASPSDEDPTTGSVGLALDIGDAHFDAFSYSIVGGQQFQKTGTIDVSNSTQLSAIIDGIPFGAGYSITLSATSSAPVSTCSGSASFAITDAMVTPVPVHIRCRQGATEGQPVPVPGTTTAILSLALLSLGTLLQRTRGPRSAADRR
jgi:hypothetical protein